METQAYTLPRGLTFDDVLLLPNYADFSRSEIDLASNMTKSLTLAAPFLSAPMDTVTEAKLAIALASLGGLGIIHRNLTVPQQVQQVVLVKKKKLLVLPLVPVKALKTASKHSLKQRLTYWLLTQPMDMRKT
jgi:IMP dehydrogenase/GMP reductase